jgi:hypothetical protein
VTERKANILDKECIDMKWTFPGTWMFCAIKWIFYSPHKRREGKRERG